MSGSPGSGGLLDRYGRRIDYLRVSVTDRCNLRCGYCMPPEGVPQRSHDEILRYEEIETVVRAAAGVGIRAVRLTGGEPLVRAGIVDLVAALSRIPGIEDVAMTTNGTLLVEQAERLAAAGLSRVNVSLDSLRPERYRAMTRRGRLEDALAGIAAAQRAGLSPVKVNAVILRGVNDDEIVDLAGKTVSAGWNVRFIEPMPVAGDVLPGGAAARLVPAEEARRRIEAALGRLEPARGAGNGPARVYRLRGANGTIGMITPVSRPFCSACNRIRLTAEGVLLGCLLGGGETDLRAVLRRGGRVDEVSGLLREAVRRKPAGHSLPQIGAIGRAMSQIGG
jgi:GTP 3',8-cyclase